MSEAAAPPRPEARLHQLVSRHGRADLAERIKAAHLVEGEAAVLVAFGGQREV